VTEKEKKKRVEIEAESGKMGDVYELRLQKLI